MNKAADKQPKYIKVIILVSFREKSTSLCLTNQQRWKRIATTKSKKNTASRCYNRSGHSKIYLGGKVGIRAIFIFIFNANIKD